MLELYSNNGDSHFCDQPSASTRPPKQKCSSLQYIVHIFSRASTLPGSSCGLLRRGLLQLP